MVAGQVRHLRQDERVDLTGVSFVSQLVFGVVGAVTAVIGVAVALSVDARAASLIEKLTASVAAMPAGEVRAALVRQRDEKVWEWLSLKDARNTSAAHAVFIAIAVTYVLFFSWGAALWATAGSALWTTPGADWTWAVWGAALVSAVISIGLLRRARRKRVAWVHDQIRRSDQPSSSDELRALFAD
jgi:hypothetical protein